MKTKSILALAFIVGCGPKTGFQNYVLPSESPCLDGTIINVDSSGCKYFFWGVRQETLKIRCTMTADQNWWVNTSFYFIPKNSKDTPSINWVDHCSDSVFRSYKGPTLIKMKGIASIEEAGKGFRGDDFKIKNGKILEK